MIMVNENIDNGRDMILGESTVPVTRSRYDQLIDTETRVNVLVDFIRANGLWVRKMHCGFWDLTRMLIS